MGKPEACEGSRRHGPGTPPTHQGAAALPGGPQWAKSTRLLPGTRAPAAGTEAQGTPIEPPAGQPQRSPRGGAGGPRPSRPPDTHWQPSLPAVGKGAKWREPGQFLKVT